MIDNIAVMLNSLKRECEENPDAILSEISRLGFKGVELCGHPNRNPEEVAELLKKYNLKLVATHIKTEDMLDNYDEVVKYQKALGGDKIVIMYGDIHGSESLSMLLNDLNSLHRILANNNIELLYHNHQHEFKKYMIGQTAIVEILNKTNVNLELDVFWAEQAGEDVKKIMHTYRDRIKLLHLKDGENNIPMPLGDGKLDIVGIYNCAKEKNFDWIVVELASEQKNPLQAIEKSMNYLKQNIKKIQPDFGCIK